jgi:Icc-related predicted phosphoesterase
LRRAEKGGAMARRVRRILAAGEPQGDVGRLKQLMDQVDSVGADAVALVGNLTREGGNLEDYRAIFKTLGPPRVQTFWVPGAADAPVSHYLRESFNMEMVYPFLHGVHGTMAVARGSSGYILFGGMGGEILDDPNAPRDEVSTLRYPAWEVEYRLKVLRELPHEYEKVFMFATLPAHKGLGQRGSEVLSQLIKTYEPRVALVAGGGGVRRELLASTLVVLPGSLARAEYAVVDIQNRELEPAKLD